LLGERDYSASATSTTSGCSASAFEQHFSSPLHSFASLLHAAPPTLQDFVFEQHLSPSEQDLASDDAAV
jgi:hypothetical protein